MFSVVFKPVSGHLSAIALLSEKLTILLSYSGHENISEMTAQGQGVGTSRGPERTKLAHPTRRKPLAAHRQFTALLESCMVCLLPCSKARTAFISGRLSPGCAAGLHGCKGGGAGVGVAGSTHYLPRVLISATGTSTLSQAPDGA